MADKTYYYKRDLGGTKEIVTISVHFKALMHGASKDTAVVDGIFQISDLPTSIDIDQQYGEMSIRIVDPSAFTITMDNKDNQVSLSKNWVIQLMQNTYIEIADQDATATDRLDITSSQYMIARRHSSSSLLPSFSVQVYLKPNRLVQLDKEVVLS